MLGKNKLAVTTFKKQFEMYTSERYTSMAYYWNIVLLLTPFMLKETVVAWPNIKAIPDINTTQFDASNYVSDLLGIPFDFDDFLGPEGKINFETLVVALNQAGVKGIPTTSECEELNSREPLFPSSLEDLVESLTVPSACTVILGSGFSIGVRKNPLPYYCKVVSTRGAAGTVDHT